MTFTVIVRAGDCPCPGTPHTEERIEMIDALTLPIASAALVQMRDAEGELGAQEAAIVTALLPACIESWSFVEANPDGPGTIPVPVSRENMERLIPWSRGGFEIAEEADSRYGADLMLPLIRRMQKSSQDGQTASSTSPNPPSSEPLPEPSEPSSPETSDGSPSGDPDR